MFSVDEAKNAIGFKISSEMKLVDRIVKEVKEFLAEAGMEDGFSSLKLALRELLINAVEHGNRDIAAMTVRCSVEILSNDLCKIEVEDEGDGFNWRALDLKLPDDPNKLRNRGFPLVNAISDKLEFNEAGNRVAAYVSMRKETGYEVSELDGWKLLKPNGDITAASSDKLREILDGLVKNGMAKCRFDLSKVSDIDSVGLSALIVLARALTKEDGSRPKMEVVNAAEDIKRLFAMTMLDTIYDVKEQAPEGGATGESR